MAIDDPIFIIGTGRSGTTIFHDVFAEHPDLAWISNYVHRFPDVAAARYAARLRDMPVLGPLLASSRLRPRPVETYEFWNRCYLGFGAPSRDLAAADMLSGTSRRLRRAVSAQLAAQRKQIFLSKWTGWARIGFMDQAFPRARYVHIVRDGRAVAFSLLHVGFWAGWGGPGRWRWGELEPEDRSTWERADRSFLVLAALQWRILMDNITSVGRALGERYREVRYEEFVEDPIGSLTEVARWAGLADRPEFVRRIRRYAFRSGNDKWRRELSPGQIASLEEAVGGALRQYGYGRDGGHARS